MKEYDLVIIGGGISGMTSALVALENNIDNVLIIEREVSLGGILNQCISNRYGRRLLGKELTGPEYIYSIEEKIRNYNIEVKLKTEVLSVKDNKEISYVNSDEGVKTIKAKAIIVATGCREKLTGNISIPLNRYTGIYTVGNAQKIIVLEGYLPGKNPIVVANCNWALSVARRLVTEGSELSAIIIDESHGFHINEYYKEIFKEYKVDVVTNSKIEEIFGHKRVEGVKVYNFDNKETTLIKADSLILSVGYLPEVAIIKNTSIKFNNDTHVPIVDEYETSVDGIFISGNLLYGMDALNQEDTDGIDAGKAAVKYLSKIESI